MQTTRRSFLVGAGALITASFVKEARVFIGDTRQPLLVPPSRVTETLFFEPLDDFWQLHLGEPQLFAPEPPLLIENLRFHGYKLDTQDDIDACCEETGWSESNLFSPLDGFSWEDQWEYQFSPGARAFNLLKEHNLFPRRKGSVREGRVNFVSSPNPMSSARFVEVGDELSLSLLQARLNELNLSVELARWHD